MMSVHNIINGPSYMTHFTVSIYISLNNEGAKVLKNQSVHYFIIMKALVK